MRNAELTQHEADQQLMSCSVTHQAPSVTVTWALALPPTTNRKGPPMFFPFLAATAVATAFAQLGAMSTKFGALV